MEFISYLIRRAISQALGLLFGAFVAAGLLVDFVKTGRAMFYKKKRDRVPECLKDPALGTHHYIQLQGIKLHYVAVGDESKPLMLLVHGFPEFWFSWRYQLREFHQDYRVVAIDQRGYNESDAPKGIDEYKMEKMTGDLEELIPALGYEKCILVGHDWGGVICWEFAYRCPHLIERLVTLNAPHPLVFKEYFSSNWKQFTKSWYMYLYNLPYLPEFWVSNTDMKLLRLFFMGDEFGIQSGIMKEEELEAYKYSFSKRGFTAPMNYYRASLRETTRPASWLKKPLEVPTLTVWGDADAAIDTDCAYLAAKYVPNYTLRIVEGASHWVQMDQPKVVNNHIREFLENRV